VEFGAKGDKMIPFYKIIWHKPDGGTVDLGRYCTKFTVKKAIQSKANIASFTLQLTPLTLAGTDFLDADGNLRFQMDQQINVYLADEPIDTSNSAHLLSALTITNVQPNLTADSVIVKIDAMDKTAHLLSKAGAKTYTGTAPEIIRDIINQWAPEISAELDTNGGYIQTTPGGTASSFPTKTYAYVYKPIFDAIDELSQPSYTSDDRPYIFWVDENNNFHWVYPDQTIDTTIEEGKDDVYSIDLRKKEQDEINMIIYNAGKDKNGNSILWYRFNFQTRSSKLKIAYYDWSEITANMQNPGYSWNGLTWDTATNDQVREHAKELANAKCEDFFARKGLLWKGTIKMKGSRNIERGQLIKIISHKFGKFGEKDYLKLRVTDIIHDVSKNGWIMTLQVEEDPLVPGAS